MSTLSRSENLEKLGDWFDRLASLMKREGFLGHLDLNTEIEFVFRDFLNCLCEWNLGNANVLFGKNHEAIDLSSEDDRIAVQVTTTQSAAKIKKTLRGFMPEFSDTYDRLIFIYPTVKKSVSRADFGSLHDGFDFDAVRDRLDLSDLLKIAQDLEIDRQKEFLDLVRKELAPLGTALQMGVEPSVEILIAVIHHMVLATVPETVLHFNPPADIQRKLNRFSTHAEYLKRQFVLNQEFYVPVNEARDAVSYDAANTPRIRLWLIQNSLSLLEDAEGNAKLAFENLTNQLLDAVHAGGRDADRTAVAYLLADEFLRCNVFPNPEEV